MVKAKDFWEYLCNELDYKFFAGVPCKGLAPLYNKMSPQFMHYIPAVTENIAIRLVTGATLASTNAAVLMSAEKMKGLDLVFNTSNHIPLFIIAFGDSKFNTNKAIYNLELTDDLEGCLDKAISYLNNKKKSCVLFIGEGTI